MTRFLLGRWLGLLLTLWLASVVVFLVLDILPGNVAQVMLGPDADPQAVQALAAQLGLDSPAWLRYSHWLQGVLRGDLGMSQAYGVPVATLLWERLTLTVPLALLAMGLAGLVAFLAGTLAVLNHRRWADLGIMTLTQVGMATPAFWLGMLLIVVFSVSLGWLPAGGFDGWEHGLWQGMRFLWLPAVALACVQGAILTRFVRTATLEAQGAAFVRTARAKGLSPAQVLRRHVIRHAAVPVLTVAGMQFAELLGGAVVIENVFSLPGLGRLLFQSIANRDLPVVRNSVLLLVSLAVLVNVVVDTLAGWADPRMRTPVR